MPEEMCGFSRGEKKMKIAVFSSKNVIPLPPVLPSTPKTIGTSNNLINSVQAPSCITIPRGKDENNQKGTNRIISIHQPKKKMKSLFWTKISNNECKDSPLWQGISIDILDSLPIDYTVLEERFSTQDVNGKSSRRRSSIADVHNNRPKSLLDSSRTQNILISAGKLRGISDDILSLIKDLNPTILTEDIVKILQNIIPTPDEIRMLRGYEGDRTLLGQGEQFLLPLCEIPRLSQRLFCHLTVLTWIPSAQKISHKLSILEKIYTELVSEDSVHHMSNILQYTVAIGNFLNGGSHRVSTAVRINSILKFLDIRSDANGAENTGVISLSGDRYTLLTFLVTQLLKHCPHSLRYVCEYWTDLISILEGELSFSQLSIDVSQLQNEIVKLREELKHCTQKLEDEQMIEWNLSLKNHLTTFLLNSSHHLEELQRQLTATAKIIQRALTVYGETVYPDNKTLEGEDASILFLGTIHKIVTSLVNTKKEVEKNSLINESSPSPRDEDGFHGRRWSISYSKSKNSNEFQQDASPTPTPPPPPPPPSNADTSPTKSNQTAPAHVNAIDAVEIPPLQSPKHLKISESLTNNPTLDSSKVHKDKSKSRTSRSKARNVTL